MKVKFVSFVVVMVACLLSNSPSAFGSDQIVVLDSPCRLYDSRYIGSANGGSKITSTTIDVNDEDLDTTVYTHAAVAYNYQGGQAGCRIPVFTIAVVVTVATVAPEGPGYARLWATSLPEPRAIVVSFAEAQFDEVSGALIRVGSGGQISVNLPLAAAHLVVDITGYVAFGTTTGISGDVASVTIFDPDYTKVVLTSGSEIWCQSDFVDTSICEDYEVNDHVVAIGHPIINTGELVVLAHQTEKKP